MQKKTKLIMISVFAAIGVIIGIVVAFVLWKGNNKKDSYAVAVEKMNEKTGIDVMVYGEEIDFREDFKYRTIEEISKETLKADEYFKYRCILLSDCDGTMEISDNDLMLIKGLVENDGYDMIYIGKEHLEDLKRLGFTTSISDNDYSLGYIGSIHYDEEVAQSESGNLYAVHGIWTKYDEEISGSNKQLMQEVLINFMYEYMMDSLNYY